MNILSWIVKELAALREAVEQLHQHNNLPPPAAASAAPAHLAPVTAIEPSAASGLPAKVTNLQGTVTFDPAAYPDAGQRIEALHALQAQHPLGMRIVDPQGNEVDVRGNSILPAATAPVDETKLELGAVGDGRHPRVDVPRGGFVDKAFGPYAAGTKFIVRTVGDLEGGGAGTKVGIEVRKDGVVLAAGEGDFRCEAQTDPALAAEEGVRYVARIINRDEKPISCHVQIDRAA